MISNSWRPVRCGVTTVLEEAASHLCARGHEVVFIAPEHPGYTAEEWPAVRFPSIALQADYRGLAPWLPLLPSFWRTIRDLQCDLFHAHDSMPFGAGYLGACLRKRLGTPLVITQHCFYEEIAMAHCASRPGGRLLSALVRRSLRMSMGSVLRQADLVLAPSEAAACDVRRFRQAETVVLPSGVAVPAVMPNGEVRHRLGLNKRTPVLLSVGRLHPDKNLHLLLDAFARVRRDFPESELILVGEGPMRARLERYARELGAADRIHFIGAVPHQEIWSWYAAANLLISTSRETQGLVFLEAMHLGVPVVAMLDGGAGSVVRHEQDGLLVANNVEAVSGAITRCLREREWHHRLSQQARERAQQFDSRLLIAELEAHYHRVLKQARAGLNCSL